MLLLRAAAMRGHMLRGPAAACVRLRVREQGGSGRLAAPQERRLFRAPCASAAGADGAAAPPAEKAEKPAKGGGKAGGKQGVEKGKGGGGKRGGDSDAATTSSAEDIRLIRLQKVAELRAAGTEPYAYRFDRTHSAAQLQAAHTQLENGQEVAGVVESVAGRVMARRVFGKLAFLSLQARRAACAAGAACLLRRARCSRLPPPRARRAQDESGSIQLYCEVARMGDAGFDALKASLDVGDIVGAHGVVRRTEKGELSVAATSLVLLTKALLPLPDKWHGLQDVEKRYRQRYVDMLTRPEVRETFRLRSLIVSHLRRSLEDQGFLEVETPVLQAEAGGADARPFSTYHNALERPLTLRIATELHLKRMVVGGFERVFELGRVFRNEGISTRHNPEFTSVELYQAYADRSDMLELTEQLVCDAAMAARGTLELSYQGTPISLARPWRRVSMNDLVLEATGGLDVLAMRAGSLEEARAAAEAALRASSIAGAGAAIPGVRAAPSVGHLLNVMFEALCEAALVQPTFVLDHPVEISPLAKPHRSQPGTAERFELFVYGRELANAFSELTDPVEQRARFQAQIESHAAGRAAADAQAAKDGSDASKEAAAELSYEIRMDEDFVAALEYGLPPTAGLGIGIDRLVMLLTDAPSIRDVIPFPLLREAN
jgi:lysyl-tRNA synthetase class 2